VIIKNVLHVNGACCDYLKMVTFQFIQKERERERVKQRARERASELEPLARNAQCTAPAQMLHLAHACHAHCKLPGGIHELLSISLFHCSTLSLLLLSFSPALFIIL